MRERAGTRNQIGCGIRPVVMACVVVVAVVAVVAAMLVAALPDVSHRPPTVQPAVAAGAGSAEMLPAAGAASDLSVQQFDVPEVAAPVGPHPQPQLTADGDVVARISRSTAGFGLVALTWRPHTAPGDMVIEVRTHGVIGWSRWTELHAHSTDGPGAGEEGADVRAGTEPLWVGDADGVAARVSSAGGTAPDDLEVVLVEPGDSPTSAPARSLSADAGVDGGDGRATAAAPAVLLRPSGVATTAASSRRPRLVSRRQWVANPRYRSRCDAPRRARTVQMVFVHHTAGTNRYSRSEAPSIVRGVYAYHTRGRGWCDIGYNFLVDRFGTAYVGRAGGPNAPVRGAHAGDYNVRTVGVSLMGNFGKARPTRAMKRKLTHLLAWKLGSYYRAPKTKARISGRRFEKISGHRAAMSTSCPGRQVARWMPRLRSRVAARAGRIQTPISRKWHAMRRHGVNLGQPFRGEAGAAGRGRKTQFGKGWVFWAPRPGAHPVRGAIYLRFRKYGATQGRLGYPRSDSWQVKRHLGKGQTFQNGRIYRHPAHGAVVIWGGVNRRYQRAGLAAGRLGVPVRNQYRVRRGWAGKFQHGRITWNPGTGRTRVRYQR